LNVTVNELAEFFGRTPRMMQLWVETQGMPRDSHGEYNLIDCARWRIRKLEEENEILKNSGDENLHAEKLKGQRISNMEREVRYRRTLNELVELEAVRMAWTNETKNFRKALKGLENKLNVSLENVTDPLKRKSIIEIEIRDLLTTLGDLRIEIEDNTDEIINEFSNE
jgi:phage terminase Nu1 subunit (DNA packaging protein)